MGSHQVFIYLSAGSDDMVKNPDTNNTVMNLSVEAKVLLEEESIEEMGMKIKIQPKKLAQKTLTHENTLKKAAVEKEKIGR